MKTIVCNINMTSLYKETEGQAWDGWFCPVWASINKEDNCIELSLGGAVSYGTSFITNDGKTPLSWVGKIECWKRTYGENDAEQWAEDYDCDAADFNSDEAMEEELDCRDFSYEEEKLMKEIIIFAKSEGYDNVEFI